MSKKHFSALLVVAVMVVVAITLLVPERTGREGHVASDLIFPGLQDRINEVDRVSVVASGGQAVATLRRGEQDWMVDELAGYPAKWATVRDLLAGLAQSRVIEIKTGNPEYYDRLGVEDIAVETAGGLLVTIGSGAEETALIVGKQAEGRDGRYLRPVDSAQSVLADFDAEVPREASGWVEREVSDIASADVAEVVIEHPDGDRIHARKAAVEDTDFSLANLPEGRELESSWSVNSLGNTLTALQLDSVAAEDAVDWSGASRVELRTFSGMQVAIDAIAQGEEGWIRLGASAVPPAVESEPAPSKVRDESSAADGSEQQDKPEITAEPGNAVLQEEVDAFNVRVAGWAYRIPSYKFEAMTKRREDLLKTPDEDEG